MRFQARRPDGSAGLGALGLLACLLLNGCGLGDNAGPAGPVTGVDRIVFVRDNQIFSSGILGRQLRALTDPGSYRTPVWSPDGTRVAFLRREGTAPGPFRGFVGVVGADGQGVRDIHEGNVSVGSLSWAPDGRHVAFLETNNQTGQGRMVLLDVDTGARQIVPADTTDTRWFSNLTWGRDRLFFSELVGFQWDIFWLDANGNGGARVTDHPQNDTFPSVSPDGRQVAFFSDRTGQALLYVQGTEGGEARKLTERAGVQQQVRWSADGRQIAFVEGGHIHTIGADGTGQRRITETQGAYLLHSWSPDGRFIAYRADLAQDPVVADSYELYVTDLSSGEQEQILDLALDIDILWVR